VAIGVTLRLFVCSAVHRSTWRPFRGTNDRLQDVSFKVHIDTSARHSFVALSIVRLPACLPARTFAAVPPDHDMSREHINLHLVSDAAGETLNRHHAGDDNTISFE
jgi:hypothetical protein